MKFLSTLLKEAQEENAASSAPQHSTALIFARHLRGKSNVELVSVRELISFRQHDRKNDPKYSQQDSDANISKLKKSIYENGFQEPLILYYYQDNSALLIEGNHRLAAAQELGITHVPVTVYFEKRESPLSAKKVSGFTPDKRGYIPSQLSPSMIGLESVYDLSGKAIGAVKQKASAVSFEDIEDRLTDTTKEGNTIVISYDIDTEYKEFIALFNSNSDIEWEELLDFESYEPYISSHAIERLNIDEYYDIRSFLPPAYIDHLRRLLIEYGDTPSEKEEIQSMDLDGLVDVWEYKKDSVPVLNALYRQLSEFIFTKWAYKKHMTLVNDFLNTRFTSPYGNDIFIAYNFNGTVNLELEEKDVMQFKNFVSTDKRLKDVILREFRDHGFALHYQVPQDYKRNNISLDPAEMGKALNQSVKELIA